MTLSMAGLIGGLALLIVLRIRGMNILIAAPICGLVAAVSSGIPLIPPMAEGGDSFTLGYMTGFSWLSAGLVYRVSPGSHVWAR